MRIANSLLVACALLLAVHAAPAFHNPQTDRWLNRDPVEERSGNNLYRLLDNKSLRRVEVLGLDDCLWIAPNEVFPPGALPDCADFTDWEEFDPEALVSSRDGCCFGLRLVRKQGPAVESAGVEVEAKGTLVIGDATNVLVAPVDLARLDAKRFKTKAAFTLRLSDYKLTPPQTTGMGLPPDEVRVAVEGLLKLGQAPSK